MKRLQKFALLLGLTVCLSGNTNAQVRQSGNVTPTHVACWTSTGVLQDCGAATSPYPTTFGVTNGSGTGICVNSDKPTAAGYQQACLGATTTGGAVLSVQKFGTAPTGGFQFLLNGATQAIPTVTLPVMNGDNACFSGTSGTLIDCGGAFGGFANPTASVGLVVVNGSATTAMRSDAAPPLSQAISPTMTGNWLFAPTSGVALTLTGPTNSLARVFDAAQSFSGTDTVTHQLNNLAISDSANLGSNVGNGLNIVHNYSSGFGSRQALQVGMVLTAPSNVANTRHFYAAAQFGAQANSSDNGTNTGAGALGSIIAFNPAVTLNSGAVNIAEASGIQVTMFTKAGSSVSQRSGIEISDNSGAGGIQGATFDDAIVMGNVTGSAGWKIGWALDCTNFGGCPISSTGTVIKTVGAQNINTFIDVLSATLTTFLKSNGFTVDGSGNVTAVGGTFSAASSIAGLTVTSSFTATGLVTNADLATMATNTIKGNATSGTASPTDLAIGSCDTATKALQWTTNTGFGCNSSITASTNANLTGPITSVGNATSIASQTGTGTKFVVDTSPTVITPTFTTSATAPLIIGGSGTTGAILTFQTTTGNGTTDNFTWNGGNNGATRFAFLSSSILQVDGSSGFYASAVNAGFQLKNSAASAYVAMTSGATGHYTVLAAPSGTTFFQARDTDNGSSDANFGYLNNDTLQVTNRANNANYAKFTSTALVMQVTTDATSTSTGAIQNPGGMSVNKRVFMNGLTTSGATQTDNLCLSSAGEVIADTAACLVSSERFKQDIRRLPQDKVADMATRFVAKSWRYQREAGSVFPAEYYRERIGLTAEDVAAIDPRLVQFDAAGQPHAIDYNGVITVLAAEVSALREQMDRLKK